jgi:putative nucleotidyltransferase with HDIG domain
MSEVKNRIRLFVAVVYALGLVCLVAGLLPWHSSDPVQFGCYLLLTAIASGLKVVLPGFEATVSVNFIFFLLAVSNLTLSEALALGATATLVQCYWKATSRMKLFHFGFNLSQVLLAISASYCTFSFIVHRLLYGRALIALLAATIVYFLFNTFPVATVVSFSERKSPFQKWTETYLWTFPYYLIGSAIAGVILLLNRVAGWEISVLVIPAMYAIYYSYRLYIGKLEESNKHLEEMASIHLRTVEALALAIEAKDHTTGDHLQRVRVYALELAKDLGLTLAETDALRAAAVLHDIGKLAVPEHIISKPGKLTPEEFDKMKVHPIVGSEICDQVKFPYPVVPIVRSHHEKWDGSGYPDGLSGEAIPIGARILAAVDCLDALASDRQYRKALPLDQAMAKVDAEAGRSFDPRVVAALKARYIELEQLAHSQEPQEKPKLSVDVKVARGAAPAAGFAESSASKKTTTSILLAPSSALPGSELKRIAAQSTLGAPDEMLTSIAMRVRHHVAFDSFVVFALSRDVLAPVFVLGESRRELLAMRIPNGKGLAGWVAETRNDIINGNPCVEPGYISGSTPLLSAIAVPLGDELRTVGVLALYHRNPAAYNAHDAEVLKQCQAEIEACLLKFVAADNQADSIPFRGPGSKLSAEMVGAD